MTWRESPSFKYNTKLTQWVYQPFKKPSYSYLVFALILHSLLLVHTSISSPSISSIISQSGLPPPSRPHGLTCPSQPAAAVTGGQEVKAKVECHTPRVTLRPGCCVSLWMESSERQTRWRDPDALTFAWAHFFPSRGTVLTKPPPLTPFLQVTITIVIIAASRADDTIILPFCVGSL